MKTSHVAVDLILHSYSDFSFSKNFIDILEKETENRFQFQGFQLSTITRNTYKHVGIFARMAELFHFVDFLDQLLHQVNS